MQVHCHPQLILPSIQCLLDEFPLITHHPRNPITVLINIVRVKYHLVSWIKLIHWNQNIVTVKVK